MHAAHVIDYEDLIQEYHSSLNNVLRGFRPKYEFLEFWVPDENAARSVKNLVESAMTHGQKSLTLFFSKSLLGEMDFDGLETSLKSFGEVDRVDAPEGSTLYLNRTLSKVNGKERVKGGVPSRYVVKLEELAKELAHMGAILEGGDDVLIRATREGINLFASVGPEDHVVHRARFSGASEGTLAALLEATCRVIEGLPMQEVSDHALMKVEGLLRDRQAERPVQGIVNIFNYPPLFEVVSDLLKGLYAMYQSKAGYKREENAYWRLTSEEWATASQEQKITSVDRVFKELVRIEGRPYYAMPLQLQVFAVDHETKVRVNIHGELSPELRAKVYFDFERLLRERLDPCLEVFSDNRKDKNGMRRLV